MKRTLLISLVIAVSGLAAILWHSHSQKTQSVPTPDQAIDEAGKEPTMAHQPEPVTVAPEPQQTDHRASAREYSRPISNAPAQNMALEVSTFNRSIDMLLSPETSYAQKRAIWSQLREAGKLDQVIKELEQRTANDPRSADCPATLGKAYLEKCATTKDVREQGILAMQADKVFDTALSLDPQHWEARFTKAVAMTFWPSTLNKGEEVVQHFQTLIQQQESQAQQPQFAATYAWLGDYYQKAGQADDARTVWQRGATLFPSDETLRRKLASAP